MSFTLTWRKLLDCTWSMRIVYGLQSDKIMDVEKVEMVHMRASRMVKQLKNYLYEGRLRFLNLPTLKYRRLQEI
jgi:hypothetical protein